MTLKIFINILSDRQFSGAVVVGKALRVQERLMGKVLRKADTKNSEPVSSQEPPDWLF